MLYVDHIFLIENDISLLQQEKIWFTKNFFMKDMSETIYILWIKIYRDIKVCLVIPIHTHIKCWNDLAWKNLNEDTYLFHVGLVSPKIYTLKHKLRERMERILYASTIRSIIYEMLCTRSNLSYILIITSKYQSNSSEDHKNS